MQMNDANQNVGLSDAQIGWCRTHFVKGTNRVFADMERTRDMRNIDTQRSKRKELNE